MNRRLSIPFLLSMLVLAVSTALAQEAPPVDHRFAIRLNLIGLASFNPIVEAEYRPAKSVGVFVGAGMPQPVLTLGWIDWFTPNPYPRQPFGMYAGANFATPIWKLKHLSVKPTASVTGYPRFDSLYHSTDAPWPTEYLRSTLGVYLNVAYAQPFCKRFFLEPVIGVGGLFGVFSDTPNTPNRRWLEYLWLEAPVQLNVGVKF